MCVNTLSCLFGFDAKEIFLNILIDRSSPSIKPKATKMIKTPNKDCIRLYYGRSEDWRRTFKRIIWIKIIMQPEIPFRDKFISWCVLWLHYYLKFFLFIWEAHSYSCFLSQFSYLYCLAYYLINALTSCDKFLENKYSNNKT